jgi:hypothetical protein
MINRVVVFLILAQILAGAAAAQPAAAPLPPAMAICATNPAYAPDVMRSVLNAQLQKDHDEALDAEPPDQMASEAAQLGIKDCTADLTAHPAIGQVLAGLVPVDTQVAWDAYNTTCSDHGATKADCMKAEVGSAQALRRMARTNDPAGSRALVAACQLVLTSDFAMVEWRTCVDMGLGVHATPARAAQCKTAVNWHVAKTGAQAGAIVAGCLRGI